MPKLLQLNVTANWGSTGKIAEGIGLAAMAHGWESTVAYGRYMNPSKSELIKVGNQFDVYAHYAKSRLFDGEGLGSRSATKKLIKQIEDFSPDIIHLHNIHDHWLNYPLLFEYLRSIGTPIVWTFHDCWAFTGGCAYFDIPDCEKWKTKCFNCPLKRKRIDLSEKQFIKRQELITPLSERMTIVPVSHWLENFIHGSMLSECRVEMIHNGIDINTFDVKESKNSKPVILGAALIWDFRKGLDDFIRLRGLIPEKQADIILVGLSKNQIESLPEGIKGLNKTQNVGELVNLYNRATVLVNPTYADNFPTVNLEALACGTPVITYRTGGSPEAVDEKTGIVVEKGDLDGLAEAITKIIENPALYTSQNCRERAVSHFNRDVQFGKYIELYEEILNKTK